MDGNDVESAGEAALVLVCPRCERRHPRSPDADAGVVRVSCSLCGTAFAAELVQVVGTRSRLDRQTGTRRFRVRVSDAAGAERVLGLGSYGHAEFPFAAGDWAIVARVGGGVRAVQDPSAGRFMKVRPGSNGWLPWSVPAWSPPAWAAAGAAAVAAVLARAWPG